MQREKKYQDALINSAIAELSKYRDMRREISYLKQKLNEYEDTYAGIKSVSYDVEHVQGGERKDRLSEIACKWADLDNDVKMKIWENEKLLWYIRSKLEKLPVQRAKVLELYYIKGYSLIKVARMLNYSYGGVKWLKTAALKNYAATPNFYP